MYGYYASYEDAECFGYRHGRQYDEDREYEERREQELFNDDVEYED